MKNQMFPQHEVPAALYNTLVVICVLCTLVGLYWLFAPLSWPLTLEQKTPMGLSILPAMGLMLLKPRKKQSLK